jgi:hypothetical protein
MSTARTIRRHPVRVAVTIGLALVQPLATQFARLTGRGVPESEQARATEGPVTPAAGAFVIWGPLFGASIAYALRSARSDHRSDPTARSVARLMNISFASNVAWSLNSQLRRLDWVSVGLIFTGAASASAALLQAERHAQSSAAARVDANLIGPLAGWLAIASFANVETTLNLVRGQPPHAQQVRRALGLLSTASAASSAVAAASRGNLLFAAAASWGLAAIARKAVQDRSRPIAVTALLGVIALATTTARSFPWRSPGCPRS